MKFEVGQKFSSFDDLTSKILRFKTESFVELWISDSRKIESAIKNKRLSKNKNITSLVLC